MYICIHRKRKLSFGIKELEKLALIILYGERKTLLNKIKNKVPKVTGYTIVSAKRIYFVRIDLKPKLLYTWTFLVEKKNVTVHTVRLLLFFNT